jgi:iron only hydrogenase large subunit-like protein
MCYEFIDRYNSKNLPILTSACPGFICYAEKTNPEIIPSISKVKSPQQIMGTLVKRYFASKKNLKSSEIYHVTVMPCYDKKLEASRDDFTVNDVNEVDCVLTTSEILSLLEEQKINFKQLQTSTIDSIFNNKSKDGNIIGVSGGGSGGYLESVFRFAAKQLFNVEVTDITYRVGRNKDYKETSLIVNNEKVLTFTQAYGFRNIQNVIKKLKKKIDFDFCEIMACPSGCLNGGGQIKNATTVKPKEHLQNVEYLYETIPFQNPFYNQNVELIYKEFIKGNIYSESSKEYFHTQYHKREKININPLQIKW